MLMYKGGLDAGRGDKYQRIFTGYSLGKVPLTIDVMQG